MNNRKTFATKGVQTDPVDCLPASKPKRLSVAAYQANILDRSASSQSSDTSSALHSLGDLDAYTPSETSFLGYPRHISDCPPVTPRRVLNYGQLVNKRLPHATPVKRRIVSLPETSPPHRVSETQGVLRLVSMPEQIRVLRSSDDSGQHLDYAEAHKLSPENNFRCSGNSGTGHINLTRLPRTPSPLESPESVMIVGNDTGVPQAFLYHRSSADTEGNGGWIPWESSPPKPIPALHGPPSLPYARCPSGAEGIIIESEDISRMVWGLNSTNSHQTQVKNLNTGIQPRQPLQAPDPAPFSRNPNGIGHSIRGQNGIDVSRLEPYAPSTNNKAPSRADLDNIGSQQRLRNDSHNEKGGFYSIVRGDSPIQLHPSVFGLQSPNDDLQKAGLGINLRQGTQENNSFPHSAPVEGRAVYHIQTYDDYRQQLGIPTPPNTDLTQWSPHFRPLSFAPATTVQRAQAQPPHLADLPQLQRQPTRLPSFSIHKTKELPPIPYERRPVTGFAEANGGYLTSPWTPDTIAANDPNFEGYPDLAQSFIQFCSVQDEPNPPSDSPDLGRNLVQRQPCSVPLVRLIQRRLSSVGEEGAAADKYTHGGTTLAPAMFKQGLGSGLGDLVVSERIWVQGPTGSIPSPSLGSQTPNTNQTYGPVHHPLRHYEGSARSTGSDIHKVTGAIVASASELKAGEDNRMVPGKTNMKQKKFYRKKKQGL